MGFFVVGDELEVVEVLGAETCSIEGGLGELAKCLFVEDVFEMLEL